MIGCSTRNILATSGSKVRRSLAPVTGARARLTFGVGDRYGVKVECTVRDRNGDTRGESKEIHSSHLSGLQITLFNEKCCEIGYHPRNVLPSVIMHKHLTLGFVDVHDGSFKPLVDCIFYINPLAHIKPSIRSLNRRS